MPSKVNMEAGSRLPSCLVILLVALITFLGCVTGNKRTRDDHREDMEKAIELLLVQIETISTELEVIKAAALERRDSLDLSPAWLERLSVAREKVYPAKEYKEDLLHYRRYLQNQRRAIATELSVYSEFITSGGAPPVLE